MGGGQLGIVSGVLLFCEVEASKGEEEARVKEGGGEKVVCIDGMM